MRRRWFSTRTAGLAGLALAAMLTGAPCTAQDEPDPDYPHGAFSEDCSLCHDADAWRPARISDEFKHGKSGFPLFGAHGNTSCRNCHASLEFKVADHDCVGCHMDVHQGELGADCDRCHTSESFIDRNIMRRAHVVTRFPLHGAHLPLNCEECHPPAPQGRNQFVNTPLDCSACHLELYLATTNPDHQAGGFPTDCDQCHSQVAWEGFDHNTTLPCVNCHLDDYLATTNPDHQGAGFPQDCAQCHGTISWNFLNGGGWDHDGLFFPIFSGTHAGRWQSCNDCHTVPSNFSTFSCLQCHPHSDQNKVDGDHSEVSGYTYDSQACLVCHPRGRH